MTHSLVPFSHWLILPGHFASAERSRAPCQARQCFGLLGFLQMLVPGRKKNWSCCILMLFLPTIRSGWCLYLSRTVTFCQVAGKREEVLSLHPCLGVCGVSVCADTWVCACTWMFVDWECRLHSFAYHVLSRMIEHWWRLQKLEKMLPILASMSKNSK